MRIAGVDGCKGGWAIATRSDVMVVTRIDVDAFDALAIDMPIGLPIDSPRVTDSEARKYIGPRRNSVFPTPPRVCLHIADYPTALADARLATGRGISKQAFHLLPKIAELDAQITPAHERVVAEAHPECSFVLMNDGEHLPSKHSHEGAAMRRALIARTFDVDPITPRGAKPDDVLDAYALLFTAERFARGEAIILGNGQRDARGLLMRIVV